MRRRNRREWCIRPNQSGDNCYQCNYQLAKTGLINPTHLLRAQIGVSSSDTLGAGAAAGTGGAENGGGIGAAGAVGAEGIGEGAAGAEGAGGAETGRAKAGAGIAPTPDPPIGPS